MTIRVWRAIVTTTCLLLLIPVATSANGPLRVHPGNPRYFTDAAGEAIYLIGLHTWVNVQDGGREFPPPKFNYDQYLDLLDKHNHNFTRLWTWEGAVWRMPNSSGIWIDPLPFQRTGPGKATDGRQKFDLTRFNDEFFERVRARAIAAGDRGIYAGIMLFQGFSVSRKSEKRRGSPWTYHPLNRANNVNGVDGDPDGDGEGYETHELQIAEVTRIQEAYVRKVVDTVGDLGESEARRGGIASSAAGRQQRQRAGGEGTHGGYPERALEHGATAVTGADDGAERRLPGTVRRLVVRCREGLGRAGKALVVHER
jgi:hypothetical protein